ncbi:hypothetical protein M514_06866 [Trichuris suis]|uniref:Uncharacterized protein n=1 Tax=Trichuris suis TaxID=68888 RepID=A0A085M507_9BILA|nr:hypothetical protein M513_06866 [Trichuris suis]KFD66757.1 hypothetical protein M514_06866 [Trichuris suis]
MSMAPFPPTVTSARMRTVKREASQGRSQGQRENNASNGLSYASLPKVEEWIIVAKRPTVKRRARLKKLKI